MSVENGEWIMYGTSEDDPYCLHTVLQLEDYINEIGFLPLFRNVIPGFSVEERTIAEHWWCNDPVVDPWEWRGIIATRGKIAYGKFFDGKAGFISLKWLPFFSNFRRDGYDFDSLWEDGKANMRQKKIMDCFELKETIYSHELKALAGFGKGKEKNFEGTISGLQKSLYLCVKEFRQKINKKGEPYGWPIAVYCKPEHLFSYEVMSAAYKEEPDLSRKRIYDYLHEVYPIAKDEQIRKVIG